MWLIVPINPQSTLPPMAACASMATGCFLPTNAFLVLPLLISIKSSISALTAALLISSTTPNLDVSVLPKRLGSKSQTRVLSAMLDLFIKKKNAALVQKGLLQFCRTSVFALIIHLEFAFLAKMDLLFNSHLLSFLLV